MYINIWHVQKGLYDILVDNVDVIGGEVRRFWTDSTINFFIGRRQTIPVNHMPALEIVARGYSPEWYATRTQNVRYNLELTLTVKISKEDNADQVLGTISTAIVAVLTNPALLQFQVQSEHREEQAAPDGLQYIRAYNDGRDLADQLLWTAPEPDTTKKRRMWDSFVQNVDFNTANGGAFGQAIMSWEGQLLQPYVADWNYFREMLTPGWSIEYDWQSGD